MNSSMNAPAVAAQKSQVTNEFDDLQNSINILSNLVDALETRLAPILYSEVASAPKDTPATAPAMCSTAMRIRDLRSQIDHVVAHLYTVSASIQL